MSTRKEQPKKSSAGLTQRDYPSSPQPVEKQEGELKHMVDRLKSSNSNSHYLINEIESKLQELWRYEGNGAVEGSEAKEPYDLMSKFGNELEVKDYVNIRLEKVVKFLREAI